MSEIKLRYIGARKQNAQMPGYYGLLIPNETVVTTTQNVWDNELKNHPDWEIEKKAPEKKEEKKINKETQEVKK